MQIEIEITKDSNNIKELLIFEKNKQLEPSKSIYGGYNEHPILCW